MRVSSLVWAILLAAGITQPGGAGTTIFIYDNASAPDTIAYHFADIATAFPADFIDNGTTPKTYRSKVNLQVGDTTTGAAATTLQDQDVGVWWDTGKFLLYRSTQTTSWTTNLGVKVGTGNKATGRNGCKLYLGGGTFALRGNAAIYGSTIESQGTGLTFVPATSGQNYELIDCIIGNKGTGSTSTISVGTVNVQVSNLYNVDFWGNLSSGSLGLITTLAAANAERCSVGINACAYFIRSAQTNLSIKDLLLFGTPSVADMSCTAVQPPNPVAWTLVNIAWSGNAPKFGNMTQPQGNIVEYRIGDMKVGDVNGNPLSGKSAKMTDVTGAVAFNTTTDANGRVAFGSGIITNAVPVADHYGSSSYVTASRGPYLVEVAGLRYYAMWPTDVNGNYEDMADLVPTQFASGGPTTWTELNI